jgi:hypothetical protein
MMAQATDDTETAGDPGERYVYALARHANEHRGAVVLLAAPGFMEDQQVVSGLARRLRLRGSTAVLAEPRHLTWKDQRASIGDTPVAAIVRFYQGEWLARLPRRAGRRHLFVGGKTPVANPGVAILSESKRLPLLWDELGVRCPIWQRLLPETRDPRQVPWTRDEGWLLKTAFCNTGDSVTALGLLPKKTWRKRRLDVWLNPRQWIAQRRFQTLPVETPAGPMYPCIGVYTIEGQACGIYGRISPKPVIDYTATDVAVLVESPTNIEKEWQ